MNLTEQQLDVIKQMGALFYHPDMIAANIGVDADDFTACIQSKQGAAYQVFMQGWLTTDILLRKSICKSAENGSNPAQQMMRDIQTKSAMNL